MTIHNKMLKFLKRIYVNEWYESLVYLSNILMRVFIVMTIIFVVEKNTTGSFVLYIIIISGIIYILELMLKHMIEVFEETK